MLCTFRKLFSCNLIKKYSNMPSNHQLDIFMEGLNAVRPKEMLRQSMKVSDSSLQIAGHNIPLNKNVHIVGFGKAALGMARETIHLVEDHIVSGILSVPEPTEKDKTHFPELFTLPDNSKSKFSVYFGPRTNLPDSTVFAASQAVDHLAAHLTSNDLLLTLITGGGSALLTLPHEGITLNDLITTTQLLAKAGASIDLLNAVRRSLDSLKGGGLAHRASPAQVVSLILSDVIGDSLEAIASGPTVFADNSPQRSLEILEQFKLLEKIPPAVLQFLTNQSNTCSQLQRITKPEPINIIVGNNRLALEAAKNRATNVGYVTHVMTHQLSGDAEAAAKCIVELASVLAKLISGCDITREKSLKLRASEVLSSLGISPDLLPSLSSSPLCLLFGGETTVTVRESKGQSAVLGGRCSHMALTAALHLSSRCPAPPVSILFGASDGLDGCSSGAGAWVTPGCVEEGSKIGLDAERMWAGCDSYTFFKAMSDASCTKGGLVQTGLTGTNVMDIVVVTIDTFDTI